jgi:pyrroline-5-carboxylate reductase
MTDTFDVAFIGGGNMAGALIEGLLKRGVSTQKLHVLDINASIRQKWESRGLSVAMVPDETLSAHRVWVLAVKPQQLYEAVQALKPFLTPQTMIISIAAGIDLATLERWLGDASQPWSCVVRAMPNTPALVERGMTGMVAAQAVSNLQREQAEAIMGAVGDVLWVQNDQMIDAITALSGSGPAYVFRFIEALIEGALKLGLDPVQAKQLALATLAGATELAAQSIEPPSVLRERVTSKGGTTEAALDVLESGGFVKTVKRAMQAAYDRAGELSKTLGEQSVK